MGNWRTVRIVGTCDANDVHALRCALDCGDDCGNFHCLCSNRSLCGLPNWGMERINVIGNLAERGYSVDDVAEQLRILSAAAPSLNVKIHCGGEHESTDCVSTIKLEDGVVTVCPPEMENIGEIPENQMAANLFDALLISELKRKRII